MAADGELPFGNTAEKNVVAYPQLCRAPGVTQPAIGGTLRATDQRCTLAVIAHLDGCRYRAPITLHFAGYERLGAHRTWSEACDPDWP